MLDINLNLYKVFYTVAQSKSYSDASNKLHLSVPSISVSINKLEYLLDTPLFYREKDGVKLTKAGIDLFKLVDTGLTSIDLGEKLTIQKNDLTNGEISIGCYSHITTFFLMDCIEKSKKDYPNLKINLMGSINSNEMFELLQKHKIDFMIDVAPIDTSYTNAIVEHIKTVHNIFVSKDKLELNNVEDFENLDFILNYDNSLSNKGLFKVCGEKKLIIKPKLQSDITEVRIDAAKRGLGIAYVMKEAVEKELEKGELFEVKVPIDLPTIKMNLIYFKEQLTKADKKFIKKYLKSC